jgi:hypothetical protein
MVEMAEILGEAAPWSLLRTREISDQSDNTQLEKKQVRWLETPESLKYNFEGTQLEPNFQSQIYTANHREKAK